MSIGSLIQRAQLYWHTVKYLKPVQIYGRFWFKFYRPRPVTTPAPALRVPSGNWTAPAQRRQSLTGDGEFYFLNQAGSLSKLGWDNPTTEKLWRYNQHYFDDLNAENANERSIWHQSLLLNWIQSNPPGKGTGWEPYPTSLRIVNWIKWRLAGHTLPSNALHSLAIQTRWLAKRLEIHLLGNHLFANAKALIFAGLVFDGAEADRWLAKGVSIVERELPEQVLSDGGNFERSPMYHSIFLEDVLDLINVANVWPAKIDPAIVHNWRQVALKMLGWLQGMTHPDWQIGLFNDAAFNVTPTPERLTAYACRMQLKPQDVFADTSGELTVKHWPDSGYVRLQSSNAVALLDVAPIGPDYLPSHANADTLSFELSLFRQRVIVNGGTSRYGVGEDRVKERQTSSHSTVEVNQQSSSEVWGGFRVAQRAYPFDMLIEREHTRLSVSCSHDGYRRLPKPVVHSRRWCLSQGSFEVDDELTGDFNEAVARYVFHPSVTISFVSQGEWLIHLPENHSVNMTVKKGHASLGDAFYSAEFGSRVKTRALLVCPEARRLAMSFSWKHADTV